MMLDNNVYNEYYVNYYIYSIKNFSRIFPYIIMIKNTSALITKLYVITVNFSIYKLTIQISYPFFTQKNPCYQRLQSDKSFIRKYVVSKLIWWWIKYEYELPNKIAFMYSIIWLNKFKKHNKLVRNNCYC